LHPPQMDPLERYPPSKVLQRLETTQRDIAETLRPGDGGAGSYTESVYRWVTASDVLGILKFKGLTPGSPHG